VILHTEKTTDPDNLLSSAVYGLTQAPLSSPWGSSPQVIASGWFDGRARIYDLRCATRSPTPSEFTSLSLSSLSLSNDPASHSSRPKYTATGTPLLTPVLVMADRWSTEPIYSLSSGGGSGAHLAAGTARHSVVSFWDVRAPKDGWSVHAPGNDRSPVFNVHLESSRLFGVTELRGFTYDFVSSHFPDPRRDG
jgi:WD40 repeat protein